MNNNFYNMIFKRKSFHIFSETSILDDETIKNIKKDYKKFIPLIKNIKTDIKILPSSETNCKRGEEYCILLYSEKKDNYLQNIGYIGEQLDLYLASLNIGTLWFGIGKTLEEKYNGLDFVIMIAIGKVDENSFRKDMFKSKRKTIDEVWSGKYYSDIANIVRFAPSACNTQPWKVESNKDEITVYRYKEPGKRGIMPANKVSFYNKIDIGIFLLFLELCLQNNKIGYNRKLFIDNSDDENTKIAVYKIKK